MDALRAIVFESLDNAVENGYLFEGWTAEEIADDLVTYCSTVSPYTTDDLTPHVNAWLEVNGR